MGNFSALIIDDEPIARDLLHSVLNSMDWPRVTSASDGEEGLMRYKSLMPDIVFVDIEMPGKNGFDTVKEILADNPRQFIVMVSAHSSIDNAKQAVGMGAKGFIVKPYTSGKIKDVVEKYLSIRRTPRAVSV